MLVMFYIVNVLKIYAPENIVGSVFVLYDVDSWTSETIYVLAIETSLSLNFSAAVLYLFYLEQDLPFNTSLLSSYYV
jgi:hypothetical protein